IFLYFTLQRVLNDHAQHCKILLWLERPTMNTKRRLYYLTLRLLQSFSFLLSDFSDSFSSSSSCSASSFSVVSRVYTYLQNGPRRLGKQTCSIISMFFLTIFTTSLVE